MPLSATRPVISPLRRDILALIIFLSLPGILLWPALLGGNVLVPAQQLQQFAAYYTADQQPPPFDVLYWDDLSQILPWQKEAQRSLAGGRFALWNHDSGAGAPLLANTQTSSLSPPWLLAQFLGIPRAQGWLALFQLWIAGAGCYAFFRDQGLRRLPALLGGGIYQLSGWSLAWLEFPNRHGPVAYFPLCLYLMNRALTGSSQWMAACSIAIALSILSSHLQFEFYLLFGLSIFGLYRISIGDGSSLRSRLCTPELWNMAARFVGIMVLALLLAAPQLIPSLELGRWSYRLGTVSWENYQARMSYCMPGWWFVQLFLPGFFGYPASGDVPGFVLPGAPPVVFFSGSFYEFCCFLGSVPVFLALVGIRQWRRYPMVRYLVAVGVVVVLLATGTPVNALLYFGFPGFSAMAGTARMLFLLEFAIAGLAAVGLQELTDQREVANRLRAPWFVMVAISVLASILVLAWLATSALSSLASAGAVVEVLSQHLDDLVVAVVLLLLAAAVTHAIRQTPARRRAGERVLAALCIAPLLGFGVRVIRMAPAGEVFSETPAIRAILSLHPFRTMQMSRGWTFGPPFDSPETSLRLPPLPPNTPAWYGIGSLESYDSLNSRPYIQYVKELQGGDVAPPENGNIVLLSNVSSPLVAEAGVDLIISPVQLTAPEEKPVGRTGELYLYRPSSIRAPATVEGPGGAIPVSIERRSGGVIEVANARGPGTLVVLETALPGWEMSVDGAAWTSSGLTSRDGLFLAAPLPHGLHRARLEYRPLAFRFGLYLACLGTALCSALLVTRDPRHPSGTGPSQPEVSDMPHE